MSADRPKQKSFPWVRASIGAAVIGALIVLGAQMFERELHPVVAGEAPAPRVPGADFPTDNFDGKDVAVLQVIRRL